MWIKNQDKKSMFQSTANRLRLNFKRQVESSIFLINFLVKLVSIGGEEKEEKKTIIKLIKEKKNKIGELTEEFADT